jgi:hypothetical protein
MPTAKDLLGTWQLISVRAYNNPEETSLLGEPLGPNPLGRVTFNASGYMNVHATDPSNTIPLSTSWLAAKPEEIAKIAKVFSSYCGWYSVKEGENGELVGFSTDVEISLDPGWQGTVQERTVEFRVVDGVEQLVLRPTEPYLLGVS